MTPPAGSNPEIPAHATGPGGSFLVAGLPGTALDAETADFLSACRPAGVILFRRNIHSAEALFQLVSELKSLLGRDLIVGVDLEGGTVNRFASLVPEMPAAMQIAATADPEMARSAGLLTGRLLSLFGFSLNFAPVLDCTFHFRENALGTRTFGSDAGLVTGMADSYIRGLGRTGINCTGKHFPGLGRADLDSHEVLPRITAGRQDLEQHDLVPFRGLLPVLDMVMVGHGAYPALVEEAGKPASMASEIIGDILRHAMGYTGPVISDDLDMGAFSSLPDFRASAASAFSAGCDLLLVCHDRNRMEEAAEGIGSILASGLSGKARGERARARIMALKQNAAERMPASLDHDLLREIRRAIRDLGEEVAKNSITLVAGRWERVQGKCYCCYPVSSSDPLSGEGEQPALLTALREEGMEAEWIAYPRDLPDTLPQRLAARLDEVHDGTILLITWNVHGKRNYAGFAGKLKSTGVPVVHLSLGLPGDCPPAAVDASLAVYSASDPSVRAAASVLAGRLPPEGKLPVEPHLIQRTEGNG